MKTLEQRESEQSRMIDELADLDSRGIVQHLQRIADDVKCDVRDGAEGHLAIYLDELVALGRVLEGIYER